MELKYVYNNLNNFSPITEEAWSELQFLFEPLTLERNEYLLKEGARVDYCYILIEGVIRVYYNNEGFEYNKTFFVSGMFPTPLTALINKAPSSLSFQALLPCELIKFSYNGFKELFSKHRCLESLLLAIMGQEWVKKEKHDIQMITNDATSNYLLFREQYPGLENKISQYHIASYLGITPIQLSRIRAQLAKPK